MPLLFLFPSIFKRSSPTRNPSLPPSLPSSGDELVDPTGQYRLHKSHSARNVGASVFKEMLIEKKIW